MRINLHQEELHRFLKSVPARSRAVLFVAIFCLFSTFGFLSDVMSVGRHPAARIVFDVGLSGIVAVLYAYAGTRSGRALVCAIAAQLAAVFLISYWAPPILADEPPRTGAALTQRLGMDALGVTAGVMLGYSSLSMFLTREGGRYLRMRAEMTLAQEIHRVLVPEVAGRHNGLEFVGASHPSGEVGGDLVDVVTTPDGRWIGYVADVSGHGVQSGVVMGMVKSASRLALARGGSIEALLADVNDVLVSLTSRNMFVTAAVVEANGARLQFSLAGHLPLLHFRCATGAVEEASVRNLPLGLFHGQQYRTASLNCEAGDVLVLITDGFVEVFDKHDHELGLDALKQVLARVGTQPVQRILEALLASARHHGLQHDDQTALVLRFTAEDVPTAEPSPRATERL